MHESRKPITVLVSVLLLGLTVGIAHADNGSTDGMNLDPRNQPVTEDLVADLASDSSVTADTEILETAVEPDCASDTALTAALGMETPLSVSGGSFGWTCGPCSISACANRPVGTRCGFNKFCVVSTICATQPLTDRCVCGTDHF
ncbi:MAG: hypothetical protein MI919_10005 [Holophagales bacterium]|nr:hypothetical protein [Holophagales bacterium]